ncbi:hypothetical protein A3A84_02820 [Candidatus Collierbacteria bacterium RIFCSPLOWO2_01_FULL_50_23]|uniref:Uncharacterized protein n=1 Tax=Candidatus Collierbacteria bacterium RIFCSPHIGHO2_01_FULL_50_25 TaxID=1817722 RepID=A0A1F5EV56_9BACT|nr:MAG: hypothetical protein A2703_01185 [Candidatus Collierbacteria bacterium RIFCSPHIGHO2_01_FULL_50_25]OGD74999.1 MAG: hypothetical protein A3A84_02820 [Candidatus Collierbacteria bacterium RIFCSPLOWO2_01_FULL_50_23]
MKLKRARSSYVLLVGMMSLMVVGSWLAYQIYSSLTKTQITQKQQAAIVPLDGTISMTDLDNLRSRRKFTGADFSAIVLNIAATPGATDSGGASSGLTQ